MARKTITTIALIGGVLLAGVVVYFMSRPEEEIAVVPTPPPAPDFIWPTPPPQEPIIQPTPAPHVASVSMTAETGTSEMIMVGIAAAALVGAAGMKRSLAS